MLGGLLTGRSTLIELLITMVLFTFSVTIHEVAHGYAAYKLGDPTAKNYGRLTLNPKNHLDLMGTICILLFGFGWAKPVPVDSRYFEHPKRDNTIVSVAGPLSNLLLAFISLLIFDKVCNNLFVKGLIPAYVMQACMIFFVSLASINVSLAIFNLLPIPPLDGSKIFLSWAPYKWRNAIYTIERFGFLGIYIVLMIINRLGIMNLIFNAIWKLLSFIVELLPF